MKVIDVNVLLYAVNQDGEPDFARFKGLRWENPREGS